MSDSGLGRGRLYTEGREPHVSLGTWELDIKLIHSQLAPVSSLGRRGFLLRGVGEGRC